MKALNKQALRVPERKRRDWSQAVMRDCDFCSQWALTIHHEDGGCICASCCDAEYTSELKGALETAIDLAEAAEHTAAVDHEAACSLVEENEEVKRKLEAAEKRIAELEARTVTLPDEPFYPDGDIDCPLAVNLVDIKTACDEAGVPLVVRRGK